jgi:hypothetical protein
LLRNPMGKEGQPMRTDIHQKIIAGTATTAAAAKTAMRRYRATFITGFWHLAPHGEYHDSGDTMDSPRSPHYPFARPIERQSEPKHD